MTPGRRRAYTLLDASGQPVSSATPGTLGGHRRLKIYGRLDCPSALRHIARGGYAAARVFFAGAATARASSAGSASSLERSLSEPSARRWPGPA